MPRLEAETDWLRVRSSGAIGVDREARVLRGYVVALHGPFKAKGRGEFDERSLSQIVHLMGANEAGTKARLSHPTLSSDGIGSFLGRAKSPRLSSATVQRGGQKVEIPAVRADLHFDATAFETPRGNLAKYVMDLAESDPEALSSSLVLRADREQRLDAKKQPLRDEKGERLPPLWRPTAIHATDIVDTGEAVDGLLSAGGALPDSIVRLGAELIDEAFPDAPRDVVAARLNAWLAEYLSARYGDDDSPPLRAPNWERRKKLLRALLEGR